MLLALELDDGFDRGTAIMFLEKSCLKGLTQHAFEVPSLNDALRADDLAEFGVEAVFGPVSVDVGEVPSAAGADIHLFDGHLVFSGPHPLGEELWVGICAEHDVAWRVESAFYSDLRIVRGSDYCRFRGRLCGFHDC